MIEKDYNDFVNEMLEGVVFVSDEEIARDTTSYNISIAHKGKKLSNEQRKKMSKSKKNMSLETRKKIADAAKNRSIEIRKKVSNTMTGKKLSEEHRKNIGRASKNRSKETIKKKAENCNTAKLSFDIARQIRQEYANWITIHRKHGSFKIFAEKYNVSPNTIRLIIINKIWKEEY